MILKVFVDYIYSKGLLPSIKGSSYCVKNNIRIRELDIIHFFSIFVHVCPFFPFLYMFVHIVLTFFKKYGQKNRDVPPTPSSPYSEYSVQYNLFNDLVSSIYRIIIMNEHKFP